MPTKTSFSKEDLTGFKPSKPFFVGIDSDGCVFDTMEIKQKKCFHSITIELWQLAAIEGYVREALEFVNLYSQWRGQNRFIAQALAFDLLRERPEVHQSGVDVPELRALKDLIASGVPLSNPTLEKAAAETGNAELKLCLKWSKLVNEDIARTVKKVPPFNFARESIAKISETADIICVSQTPEEALVREWAENDLLDSVAVIAGQELGTKSEHLKMATGGRYEKEHVLMVGDAPGDLKAALANNACFYPINPGHETASWQRLHDEAFDRFINGSFSGEYQQRIIAEFNALLPSTPPWQSTQ